MKNLKKMIVMPNVVNLPNVTKMEDVNVSKDTLANLHCVNPNACEILIAKKMKPVSQVSVRIHAKAHVGSMRFVRSSIMYQDVDVRNNIMVIHMTNALNLSKNPNPPLSKTPLASLRIKMSAQNADRMRNARVVQAIVEFVDVFRDTKGIRIRGAGLTVS